MSKWENKKENLYPEVKASIKEVETDDETARKERLTEWTFQLAKTMISTNRWTISVVPSTAYNLAKEIDTYLQSVGLLPKSSDESPN